MPDLDISTENISLLRVIADSPNQKLLLSSPTVDKEARKRLAMLRDLKLIEHCDISLGGGSDYVDIFPKAVRMTIKGNDFLSQHDRTIADAKAMQAEKEAQAIKDQLAEERQEKWQRSAAIREWVIGILGVVASAITFIIGVLVDNNAPIKQWILTLFK